MNEDDKINASKGKTLQNQRKQFEEYIKNEKKRRFLGCFGFMVCIILVVTLFVSFSFFTAKFLNEIHKEMDQKNESTKDIKQTRTTVTKNIGETAKLNDIEFTLNNIKYTDERNEFANAESDRVLKADVTITNKSD